MALRQAIGSPKISTLVAVPQAPRGRLPFSIKHVSMGFGFLSCLVLGWLAISAAVPVLAHVDIHPSAYGSETDIEAKILDQYIQEDEQIRSLYAGVTYFDQSRSYTNEDLEEMLATKLIGLKGEYSVVSRNLETGEVVAYQSDMSHTMASLSKLFVSAYALKHNSGDERVRAAVRSMLHASDNAAFDKLIDRYGISVLTRSIQSEQVAAVNLRSNMVSADAVEEFLQKLFQGSILAEDEKQFMMQNMTHTIHEDRIPASLPTDGITVAHKIGTWEGNYHDAGIVKTPNGTYSIVVMTSDADYNEAIDATRDVSRLLYEYWKIKTPIVYDSGNNQQRTQ